MRTPAVTSIKICLIWIYFENKVYDARKFIFFRVKMTIFLCLKMNYGSKTFSYVADVYFEKYEFDCVSLRQFLNKLIRFTSYFPKGFLKMMSRLFFHNESFVERFDRFFLSLTSFSFLIWYLYNFSWRHI